ncbi:SMP-30/gluconolactonase/LRE family protein [Flexibacterium corallicola]|uniref:SMP-30/gluconolactonase/LRE family protein n=1 Tax=Flexibacterium corallicola TaxID=3037259 RepID=UPI00286EFB0F|nr:SMP-30/gluconolactonase/LRE family protein [Pseudovibrio sp. M1P-2-3]
MHIFTRFHDSTYKLAESIQWDSQSNRLFYCDIIGQSIHALDWNSKRRESWDFPKPVGSFGLCKDGGLVIAMGDEIVLFRTENGKQETIAHIESDNNRTRLNDGKVGPDGSFWVGTMDDTPAREPIAALYRVDASGNVHTIETDIRVSNGLAWTKEGTRMFHSDSSAGWVNTYDFDPKTGQPSNRARFLQLDNTLGRPDGATVDAEGNYWSAGVSAGNLNCFSPSGELIQSYAMPVPKPTMPCFAGPDMKTLVVTSLQPDTATLQKYPLSGSLFSMKADDYQGVEGFRFG